MSRSARAAGISTWGFSNTARMKSAFYREAAWRWPASSRELDQLKDDFVAAVSHEFRSPLAAIESYLNRIEVMRKRGDPPETWLAHLEPIRQSCQRLERYVDDLLDVAYYETGKLSLDRRTTDLAQLAQDVVNSLRIEAAGKTHRR